jgi:hypothetical protein
MERQISMGLNGDICENNAIVRVYLQIINSNPSQLETLFAANYFVSA